MAPCRIVQIFSGHKSDLPVCSSPVVNVTLELMEITGARYPEALGNPELMARLGEASYTIVGFEGIRIPFDLCIEGEALGCALKPPAFDSPPSIVGGAFESPDQWAIPQDVWTQGRFPAVFEAASILQEKYNGQIPIYGGITGPFTLAGHLYTVNKFLRLIIKDPEKVRLVLNRLAEFNIEYANRLLNAGCDIIAVIDPTASGDLISEKAFRTFILPVYQKLHRGIRGKGLLHICGNTNSFLPLIAETGLEGFSFEGPAVEVKKARETLGNRVLLIGNVPTQTLLLDTPDKVKKECWGALEGNVDLLAPSCGIPLKAPLSNLKAMVESVREFKAQRPGL